MTGEGCAVGGGASVVVVVSSSGGSGMLAPSAIAAADATVRASRTSTGMSPSGCMPTSTVRSPGLLSGSPAWLTSTMRMAERSSRNAAERLQRRWLSSTIVVVVVSAIVVVVVVVSVSAVCAFASARSSFNRANSQKIIIATSTTTTVPRSSRASTCDRFIEAILRGLGTPDVSAPRT